MDEDSDHKRWVKIMLHLINLKNIMKNRLSFLFKPITFNLGLNGVVLIIGFGCFSFVPPFLIESKINKG